MLKDSKDSTVAIIGQGYVGLPLSMALIESDWIVIGIDIDEVKVIEITAHSLAMCVFLQQRSLSNKTGAERNVTNYVENEQF